MAIGLIEIPLPGGLTFALGSAAGPLLVGMVLGALERTGPVVWGMPGPEDFDRAEAGEFALGGCCVPTDFGTVDYWACRDCGQQFPVRPLVNDSPVGRLLEEISFGAAAAPDGETVKIDAAFVDARLADLAQSEDLARYIL